MVPLAQFVQLNPHPPKGLNDSRQVSFLSMASISEDGVIVHQETRLLSDVKRGFTYFQRGDVLLAKITPCFENGKSAPTESLEHEIGFGSTEFHVLRAIPEKFDSRFLFHLVRSSRLRFLGKKSMKGAAGHKRVPADFLEKFEIPAWPLHDQIRIAHLLGKVEGLIAQRKQHLQQLDDLLKSVFLEMFGDPVRNDKRWEIQPCEKAVLDISSGTSYGGEDRPFSSAEEIGVLKISAVTKGTFDPTEFKVVNRAQIAKALRFVKRGDFLFSRANTVELVAACCVVPQDYGRLFLPDKLWALTLNDSCVNPQFFNYLLKNEHYRNVVRSLASGGHDSMLNISMKKFLTLDIPCPPIDIQCQFASIVEKVEGLRSRYQQSLGDLDALYGTLSQKALLGELDLSRVPLPANQAPQIDPAPPPKGFVTPTEELNRAVQFAPPESRSELLARWFNRYLANTSPDVSLGSREFLEAAWQTLQETRLESEGESPALTLADYDALKELIFAALEGGKLVQTFTEKSNRVSLHRRHADWGSF